MSGCTYTYDAFNGDGDCGYDTTINCEDCIYSHSGRGRGRKNPEALINQSIEVQNEHRREQRKLRKLKNAQS